MKVWIAYQDFNLEGKEVLAVTATEALAMSECQKREDQMRVAQHRPLEPIKWAYQDALKWWEGDSSWNDYIVLESEVIGA